MAKPKSLLPKSILLVIAGGIAAYKALDLIRRLREAGYAITPVLTQSAQQFVTPLSVAALAGSKVYSDLFSLTDETEMGHIQLSRAADLLLVAPATANIMAKLAHGQSDDLASTLLLATDKPVMIAPAMNVRMWHHPATQRNLAQLRRDGVRIIGPKEGPMACGEHGLGRMSEPAAILGAVENFFRSQENQPLRGRRALVTAGPTHEAIDPVRFIGNYSSGIQGYAIAEALRDLGADCVLVSGPTALADPPGLKTVRVTSARDMLAAVEGHLPADIAVMTAAVADWRAHEVAPRKIKKNGAAIPSLSLVENPDILETVSQQTPKRPRLVVGFAAETGDLLPQARAKRTRKKCDWIIANDVGADPSIFGGTHTNVHIVTESNEEAWGPMEKIELARKLAARIAEALA